MTNRQTTNSPDGDEWFTPPDVMYRVREFFAPHDYWMDVASCEQAQSIIRAPRYLTKKDDALLVKWGEYVWMNPPYSQPLIGSFMAKLSEEKRAGRVIESLTLTNASTDTRWFQTTLSESNLVLFFQGRLSFWHPDKQSGRNPTGQALFYYGDRGARFVEYFGEMGCVMQSSASLPKKSLPRFISR
jgi:phage N-6-adenine-methyltransferase